MLRLVVCITQEHDLRLVVLAGIVCLFACFTAVSLLGRAADAATVAQRWSWLGLSASITGCGVWATHFVAMLAYRPGIPLGYDVALTVLSVVVAIVVTGIGFAVMTIWRNMALLGGAITGIAVGAMHYIGMAAMDAAADHYYDPMRSGMAVGVGIALSAVAFQLRSRYPNLRGAIGAALVLTLAICGLHFVGMSGLSLLPDAFVEMPKEVTSPEWLAVAVSAVTFMIIVLGLAGSVMDRHLAERNIREAESLREHIAALEATRQELQATAENLGIALTEAEASNRAKSQFLAMISHELRTPLNAVIGFSELMSMEAFGPLGSERYREYASSIRQSGAHLLGVINDVLDFAKLDARRLTLDEAEIDIGEVVAGALVMVRAAATAAGLVLSRRCASGLPRLRGDPLRVRQVLLNLLFNAVKFTPEGGRITVVARCRAGRIVLRVSDTGIGIAAADIPKAMELFGQVDSRLARTSEGTGLGLPLAKQLMELHGGALDLRSKVPGGTKVTLTFPAERTCSPSVPALREAAD